MYRKTKGIFDKATIWLDMVQ